MVKYSIICLQYSGLYVEGLPPACLALGESATIYVIRLPVVCKPLDCGLPVSTRCRASVCDESALHHVSSDWGLFSAALAALRRLRSVV